MINKTFTNFAKVTEERLTTEMNKKEYVEGGTQDNVGI